MTLTGSPPDHADVQRRTVRVLVLTQILGAAGLTTTVAIAALLVKNLTGRDDLAGFATGALTVGGAIAAIWLARLSAARGRRPGLATGYLIAAIGASVVVVGAQREWLVAVLAGIVAIGFGQASNLQARFAAADLAEPDARAGAIATLVWSTTIGAVAGPNLAEPMRSLAESVGMAELAGPFVASGALFAAAGVAVWALLRPDPLVLAGGTGSADGVATHRPSPRRAWRVVRSRPLALVALVSMAGSHLVMVGVMAMTPLHLDDAGQSLSIVGFVISVHILGMYAFSPLVGRVAVRFGQVPALAIGAVILVVSTQTAAHTDGAESAVMTIALFGLGIGWSFALVAGSALLVNETPPEERVGVQGLSDLSMSACGGIAGIGSGFIKQAVGFSTLSYLAMAVAVAILLTITLTKRARHVS